LVADINLSHVSKSFGSVDVIPDLSLDVRAGEFVVFLGPSGCGKSTLLRMIAGLETVSDGTIAIGGRRVDQLPPGERGVAMVFQTYALYPHMTVYENMAFGLKNVGTAAGIIKQKIADAARILEIEHLLDRRPEQLSGGQRQRVAIGRAIVKQPQAFLFDEPLSNLDATLRARTRVELAKLHQAIRATMIFVTHDQVEAMTLADRIVVLNQGRVEQIGTPIDIYRRPQTRFVAGFIGSPSMNFLTAEPAGERDGRARMRLSDGTVLDVALPTAALPRASRFELGIRAEHLQANETGQIPVVADVVEHLGDRTLVYARLKDDSQIVFEDRGDSAIQPGDALRLTAQPEHFHIFDDNGRAHRLH
jgi:multiple sugar transport system ATP-binding protein